MPRNVSLLSCGQAEYLSTRNKARLQHHIINNMDDTVACLNVTTDDLWQCTIHVGSATLPHDCRVLVVVTYGTGVSAIGHIHRLLTDKVIHHQCPPSHGMEEQHTFKLSDGDGRCILEGSIGGSEDGEGL